LKGKGGGNISNYNYSILVSPFDCTGCSVCAESCPDDALKMTNIDTLPTLNLNDQFDYARKLEKQRKIENPLDKYTVKGSQFEQPLMEFSCACAGCGETPYVKLVTQLYGHRMVIANASGCTSVWMGTAYTSPFNKNIDGQGPTWGRSLFEDNAEYGYGMFMGGLRKRKDFIENINNILNNNLINDDFINEKLSL